MELIAHTIAETQRHLVSLVSHIMDEARSHQHPPHGTQEARRLLETYCTSLLNRPYHPEPVNPSNDRGSNNMGIIDLTQEDNV